MASIRRYPVAPADIIDPEAIAQGRVYLDIHYKDYIDTVNRAFFDGFLLATCDSKEAIDTITKEERVSSALTAIKKLHKLLGYTFTETEEVTK